MNFKKLNKLQALLLKIRDKKAYKVYKFAKKISEVPSIPLIYEQNNNFVNFKHSGHLGDIIYAIPTMYALTGKGKINLYLNIDEQIELFESHPLGKVALNEKSVILLKSLLLLQPKFNCVEIYDSNQEIDYDLDLFRKFPLSFEKGNISRWYFNVFATTYDLGKPWLSISPDTSMNNKIIIARSTRYNAPLIDYSILNNYDNLVFVGLPEEYEIMQAIIPNLEYKKTNDFMELASVIAGAKLFIGNQSSPFALAEALKVPRILESYYLCPNVIPEGANAYEFSFQPQFEYLVKSLI
jgi:hypothetical protein